MVRRRFCHLGGAEEERGKRPVTPCGVSDRRATEPDESLKPPQPCLNSVSASMNVYLTSGAAFWWFSEDFINFLLSLPQSEGNWYSCISCTVAYAVIRADDCAKPPTAVGEPTVGFKVFGSGTESCQSGGYGPGTKIWRKAIVAVN